MVGSPQSIIETYYGAERQTTKPSRWPRRDTSVENTGKQRVRGESQHGGCLKLGLSLIYTTQGPSPHRHRTPSSPPASSHRFIVPPALKYCVSCVEGVRAFQSRQRPATAHLLLAPVSAWRWRLRWNSSICAIVLMAEAALLVPCTAARSVNSFVGSLGSILVKYLNPL
jgi:hypothetical protein